MLHLVQHMGTPYDREQQVRLMRLRFEEAHDQYLLMVDRVIAYGRVLIDLQQDFERLVREEPIMPLPEEPQCYVIKFPGPKAS